MKCYCVNGVQTRNEINRNDPKGPLLSVEYPCPICRKVEWHKYLKDAEKARIADKKTIS